MLEFETKTKNKILSCTVSSDYSLMLSGIFSKRVTYFVDTFTMETIHYLQDNGMEGYKPKNILIIYFDISNFKNRLPLKRVVLFLLVFLFAKMINGFVDPS